MIRKLSRKQIIFALVIFAVSIFSVIAITYYRTLGRVQLQFDIHQNKELIYLSTFAEPPQFSIWLENPKNNKTETVFVTSRVSLGDWEGKANVPVALPRWYELFRTNDRQSGSTSKSDGSLAVTGATPKADYFSVRVDVPPHSDWIIWIEMNLAGDFNEAFPEMDRETFMEDEFSCGQPALLFRAEITAEEGTIVTPEITAQSVWEKGENRVEPVSDGVISARNVFDDIKISVIKPKMKLIEDKVKNL
jgi:hypothetical protein